MDRAERDVKNIIQKNIPLYCGSPPFPVLDRPLHFRLKGLGTMAKRLFVSQYLVDRVRNMLDNPSDVSSQLTLFDLLHWKTFKTAIVLCCFFIVTLILVIAFIAAQIKVVRKAFGFCLCGFRCMDRPRALVKDVAMWRKTVLAVVFVLTGCALFLTCLSLMSVTSFEIHDNSKDAVCRGYLGAEGLVFGDKTWSGPSVSSGLQETEGRHWSGLEPLKKAENELASNEPIRQIKAELIETQERLKKSLDLFKQNVSSLVSVMKNINEAAVKADHVYPASSVVDMDEVASDMVKRVENYSGEFTEKFNDFVADGSVYHNSVQKTIEQSRNTRFRFYGILEEMIPHDRLPTALEWLKLRSRILFCVCIFGLLLMIYGWIIGCFWGASALDSRQPSSQLVAATTASYILYGVLACVAIGLAVFICTAGGIASALCELADYGTKTWIYSNNDALQGVPNVCFGNGTGRVTDIPLIADVLDDGRTEFQNLENTLQQSVAKFTPDSDMIETARSSEVILNKFSWISLLNVKSFLVGIQSTNPDIYRSLAGNHDMLQKVASFGIQEPSVNVVCRETPKKLRSHFCSKDKNQVILGLDDFQKLLNEHVAQDKLQDRFCITENQCRLDSTQTPIGSATMKTTYSPETRFLLLIAQKKQALRNTLLSCGPLSSSCSVSTLLDITGATVPATSPNPASVSAQFGDVVTHAQNVVSTKSMQRVVTKTMHKLGAVVQRVLSYYDTIDCRYLDFVVNMEKEALCDGAVSPLASYGFLLTFLWSLSIVMMILMFTLWHFARDTIHVAPKFDGEKPNDVILGDVAMSQLL